MRRAATTIAVAAVVVTLAFADGGYFPSEWGVLLFAFALALGMGLFLTDRLQIGAREWLFVAAFGAVAAWQLASILWASGAGSPVMEAERTLIYAIAIASVLVCTGSKRLTALVHGLGLGASLAAIAGLMAHLFPSEPRVTGERLADPVGYANADGLLAGFALLFAFAIASHHSLCWRVFGAAAAVPLITALYLSFSRGSLVAVAIGFVALFAAERDRSRLIATLLALAVPCGLGVALAASSDALTGPADLDAMQNAGRRLALLLVPLAALAVAAGQGLALLWRRWKPTYRDSLRVGIALAATASTVLTIAVVREGGPVTIVDRSLDAFVGSASDSGGRLTSRFFNVSGSSRADYWKVALRMAGRNPLHGEGAGDFERWWLAERPLELEARDAHSLYLEALAEIGLVGLLLLLAALILPFGAIRRARATSQSAPVAFAIYVTFVVHAGLDWDWEIPVLTLLGLTAGAALLMMASTATERPLRARWRDGGVVACAALGVLAMTMHVGYRALEASETRLDDANTAGADRQARRARTWLPWSPEPWRLLGEARLANGDRERAKAALDRAIALDPERWDAWYDLALVTRGAEHRRALQRAKELNPLSAEVGDLAERSLTNP